MRSKITKKKIFKYAAKVFAENGYDQFSMRLLAKEISIAPSVLYHYFSDKDALLKEMFDYLNTDLGIKRGQLKNQKTAAKMLKQRIIFQLDNAEAIVAVLKYFITYRKRFPKYKKGYVPDKSSLHIEEVLQKGIETGEFYTHNLINDAKVITHAINGFLLEYYPDTPQGNEKTKLVNAIYDFLIRSISQKKGGENV